MRRRAYSEFPQSIKRGDPPLEEAGVIFYLSEAAVADKWRIPIWAAARRPVANTRTTLPTCVADHHPATAVRQ
jgi:hypothetical protein